MEPRLVHCIKLDKDAPGLDFPPFGGPLGVRVWQSVSAEAWKGFVDQFKMFMNESGLRGGSPEATRAFLANAERYFFGEGGMDRASGYVPPAPTETP